MASMVPMEKMGQEPINPQLNPSRTKSFLSNEPPKPINHGIFDHKPSYFFAKYIYTININKLYLSYSGCEILHQKDGFSP